MVFISKNIVRKCKYCENLPKKNISKEGINKGYYRTCGSNECLKKQYENNYVCILKGKVKKPEYLICVICDNEFKQKSSNHKRYCLECVPERSWRARASRYGIGKKQWDFMLQNQKGCCALCERIPEVVDHCHKEGIVRGLLCNSCNTNLKFLEKELSFLNKVFKYLGRDYAFQE